MKILSELFFVAFCLFTAVPEGRAASICDAIAGNLASNCGFETGDFTGWTLSGNDVPGELDNLYGVEGQDPVDSILPNSGSYQAFFADLVANATTLSQTIVTNPGDDYTVSWYLAQDTQPGTGQPPNSNEFMASLDGVLLANLSDVPVHDYDRYSATVTVTDPASVLSLTLGNDLGQFLLDDVSVVATPSPEPSAWKLALAGVVVALAFRRVFANTVTAPSRSRLGNGMFASSRDR